MTFLAISDYILQISHAKTKWGILGAGTIILSIKRLENRFSWISGN
jgi:hypothetical protein